MGLESSNLKRKSRVAAAPSRVLKYVLVCWGALIFSHAIEARDIAPPGEALAKVAVIIDDMGHSRLSNLDALELPGPVTFAFLPHTPFADRLARLAFSLDKEVLLHMPMESLQGRDLGAGGLYASLDHPEFIRRLDQAIATVPHAQGVNNHMGSHLTASSEAMDWVMGWMKERGDLYFLDSRTSSESVALRRAQKLGLRAAGRDVFLDHSKDLDAIYRQFDRLVSVAKQRGEGIAIGHPYPETISVLAELLPKLSHYGVELVPLSAISAISAQDPSSLSLNP